jgi:hypothetical protein
VSCIDNLIKEYDFLDEETARRVVETANALLERQQGNIANYGEARARAKDGINSYMEKQFATKVLDTDKAIKNWEHINQPEFKQDVGEAIRSLLERTNLNVKGRDFNVSSTYTSTKDRMSGWFYNQVRAKKLEPVFKDPAKQKEIYSQIADAGKSDFKPSTDPNVIEAVKIVNQLNNKLIEYRQGAGSTITANSQYVFTHTHDLNAIRGNTDKWVQDLFPRLDKEKTFGDATISEAKAREILLESFRDMDSTTSAMDVSVAGGKRQLIFKSGDDFMEYNATYGYRDLTDGLLYSIDRTARVGALEGRLGSKPREALQQLKDLAGKAYGPDSVKGFNNTVFERSLNRVMGSGAKRAEGWVGDLFQWVQALKSLNVVTKLGSSILANAWDVPVSIIAIKGNTGKNIFQSTNLYARSVFESSFGNFNPQTKQYMAIGFGDMLETSALDMLGTGGERITGIPGALAKAATLSQKLNGNEPVTRMSSRSNGIGYGVALFDSITTDSPNSAQKGFLDRFGGVSSKEKSALLKAHSIRVAEAGVNKPYIGPGSLIGLTAKDLDMSLREFTTLQQKMDSAFGEAMNPSIKASGRENTMMRRDLPQDDPYRILSEAFFQFKASIVRGANTMAAGIRASNPSGELYDSGAIMSIAQLAVMGMAVAEGQRAVRGWIRGKDYEPITAENFHKRALQGVASAGLIYGPIGDALLGNHWHYYKGGWGDALGPVANQTQDYVSFANALLSDPLFREMGRDGSSKVGSQGVRLLKSHIPNHILLDAFRAHMMEDVLERLRDE